MQGSVVAGCRHETTRALESVNSAQGHGGKALSEPRARARLCTGYGRRAREAAASGVLPTAVSSSSVVHASDEEREEASLARPRQPQATSTSAEAGATPWVSSVKTSSHQRLLGSRASPPTHSCQRPLDELPSGLHTIGAAVVTRSTGGWVPLYCTPLASSTSPSPTSKRVAPISTPASASVEHSARPLYANG